MKTAVYLATLTLAAVLLGSSASLAGNLTLGDIPLTETNGGVETPKDPPHEEPGVDPRDNGDDKGTIPDDKNGDGDGDANPGQPPTYTPIAGANGFDQNDVTPTYSMDCTVMGNSEVIAHPV